MSYHRLLIKRCQILNTMTFLLRVPLLFPLSFAFFHSRSPIYPGNDRCPNFFFPGMGEGRVSVTSKTYYT